jgi:hypothetical protein
VSVYEDINNAIRQEVELLNGAIVLSPSVLAEAAMERFSGEQLEPHIQYASLEHFKQMARIVLGRRFDSNGDQNTTHQGELFSGQLQERYPVPRKKGEEPIYKRLAVLSASEIKWNSNSLRKSAGARLEHADALDAYGEKKYGAAA